MAGLAQPRHQYRYTLETKDSRPDNSNPTLDIPVSPDNAAISFKENRATKQGQDRARAQCTTARAFLANRGNPVESKSRPRDPIWTQLTLPIVQGFRTRTVQHPHKPRF